MALTIQDVERRDPSLGVTLRKTVVSLQKAVRASDVPVNLDTLNAQVLSVFDASLSMFERYNLHLPVPKRGMFSRQPVQDPIDASEVALASRRSLAVAGTVDPDQTAQGLLFGNRIRRASDIALNGDYATWLSSNLLVDERGRPVSNRRDALLGSTRLDLAVLEVIRWAAEILGVPAIAQNAHTNGGWRPVMAPQPLLVPLIIDGGADDAELAKKAFRAASYCPIEFIVIFVGNDRRGEAYVDTLNDLDNTFVDAVNVVKFKTMSGASDEDFADAMFQELPSWIKSARGKLVPANFAI